MSIEIIINPQENHRIIQDNINGRIYNEEFKCHACGTWINEQEAIWAKENGELNTTEGNPYCDECLPSEEE
jgi:hypothetical protein